MSLIQFFSKSQNQHFLLHFLDSKDFDRISQVHFLDRYSRQSNVYESNFLAWDISMPLSLRETFSTSLLSLTNYKTVPYFFQKQLVRPLFFFKIQLVAQGVPYRLSLTKKKKCIWSQIGSHRRAFACTLVFWVQKLQILLHKFNKWRKF